MIRSEILLLMVVMSFGAYASKTDTLAIETKYLASPENVVVITPDRALHEECPTVYILNGYSDNHLSWLGTRPDLPRLADEYGFVFVLPDGRDSWYWDSPIDSAMRMETFFVKDLVPYIDSHYPVVRHSSKRAVTGLSMGGHGAFWLALRHPDVWGNAGSMSGGLDIRPFREKWKMKERLGEDSREWENHTVINLVSSISPGSVNLIFDCGTNDFFFDVNNKMHEALLAAGIPHDYTVRPGGHTHQYWANSILYHLVFFNEHFKK